MRKNSKKKDTFAFKVDSLLGDAIESVPEVAPKNAHNNLRRDAHEVIMKFESK